MAKSLSVYLSKELEEKYEKWKGQYGPTEIFKLGLEFLEKKEELERSFKDNEIKEIKELLKSISNELKIIYDVKNDFIKLDKNLSVLNELYTRVTELSKLKDELFQLNVSILQSINKIKEDPELIKDKLYLFYKEVMDTLRNNNIPPQVMEQVVLLYRKYRNGSQ